jgi:uncharacterized protein (DUF2236 family)
VRARLLQSDHVHSGPGSVTWKINREMIVVASWGRAVLLQLAHPSIAAGVHHHSSFRGSLRSSYRRLRSTVGAMLSLTFGDTEQMITTAAGIMSIHDRVRGRVGEWPVSAESVGDFGARRPAGKPRRPSIPGVCEGGATPPAGILRPKAATESADTGHEGAAAAEYSAHDPDLQRWVHATLLESSLLTYELLVGPLTPCERDRYCAEAVIMEPLLGMPAGSLPRDAAELDTYMRGMLAGGRIAVTDTSRAVARALLYPPHRYAAWPAFRALQLLAIGSLPPSLRPAYGFEWRARDARALARWTALLRTSQRLLPPVAREWPAARARSVGASAGSREPCSPESHPTLTPR